eukprot:2767695-Pleurochrysis_carterae.AAC.3
MDASERTRTRTSARIRAHACTGARMPTSERVGNSNAVASIKAHNRVGARMRASACMHAGDANTRLHVAVVHLIHVPHDACVCAHMLLCAREAVRAFSARDRVGCACACVLRVRMRESRHTRRPRVRIHVRARRRGRACQHIVALDSANAHAVACAPNCTLGCTR